MTALLDVRLEFDYLTRRRSFLELGRLAARGYDGHPRESHTNEALWRAFPRGYVGSWIDGDLKGCIQLWPLDGRRAGDFLVGARSERDLSADDFATVCNSPRTVWYFSGLLLSPEWRGRGLAAHLLAEAMVRWHRDLPWRAPTRFAATAVSHVGLRFIEEFGMQRVRPAAETVDGHDLYARTFDTEEAMFEVVAAARMVADRKGRLIEEGGS
jgi:GNAT superfamily N-acetyltransferase